jgi:hypothetical protein
VRTNPATLDSGEHDPERVSVVEMPVERQPQVAGLEHLDTSRA